MGNEKYTLQDIVKSMNGPTIDLRPSEGQKIERGIGGVRFTVTVGLVDNRSNGQQVTLPPSYEVNGHLVRVVDFDVIFRMMSIGVAL